MVKGPLRRRSRGRGGELLHSRRRGDGRPWSEALIETRLEIDMPAKAFCHEEPLRCSQPGEFPCL